MAKKLGIKRIVLARETPVEVIKEIKEKSGLEIDKENLNKIICEFDKLFSKITFIQSP